jgi:hypothetical protein
MVVIGAGVTAIGAGAAATGAVGIAATGTKPAPSNKTKPRLRGVLHDVIEVDVRTDGSDHSAS